MPIIGVLVACGLFWTNFGVSEDLHSQLTKAASSGNTLQVMSTLDKGIPPNARDSQGKTAFGLAALNGQIGIWRSLRLGALTSMFETNMGGRP